MKILFIQAEKQEPTEAILCPHCGYEHLYSWISAAFYQHDSLSCYICGADLSLPTTETAPLYDKQAEINCTEEMGSAFLLPQVQKAQ